MTREPDVAARVLVYDIETSPNVGYTWEKWQTNVVEFVRPWHILSFAYKWLGEKKVHCVSMPDFPLYQKEPHNDLEVVKALHALMCVTDVAVTHNGKAFDNKRANSRFLVHGLDPPPPRKEIDTLLIARKHFGFASNSLGDLCKQLGLPHKGNAGGFSTWEGCMDGDPKAWERMRKYNMQDIPTLEALYLRFRPWMANHPNLSIYGDRPSSCPKCGHDKMIIRGYYTAGVTQRVNYQCNRCRGYSVGRRIHNTPIKFRNM